MIEASVYLPASLLFLFQRCSGALIDWRRIRQPPLAGGGSPIPQGVAITTISEWIRENKNPTKMAGNRPTNGHPDRLDGILLQRLWRQQPLKWINLMTISADAHWPMQVDSIGFIRADPPIHPANPRPVPIPFHPDSRNPIQGARWQGSRMNEPAASISRDLISLT